MREEVKTVERKGDSILQNKKVKVVPIKRKGSWLGKGHAAEFLFGEAKRKYTAPKGPNGRIVDVLTKEEEEFLSKELRRDLSVFSPPKENYWTNHYVALGDSVRILNLADPQDYLDWKLLLANKNEIAPSGEDKYKKGTYKFAISSLDFEDDVKANKANNKKEAYIHFGKLEAKGKYAMIDFLSAYYFGKPGKRVAENADIKWVTAELDRVIEEDLEGYLAISKDGDIEYKILIQKAISKNALYKNRNSYSLPDTNKVIAENLDSLILWFKDPANSEEVVKIEAKIEN